MTHRSRERVAGLIVAGGQSRRMGTPKAQLVVAGRLLLQHLTDLLFASGCEHVVIAVAAGQKVAPLRRALYVEDPPALAGYGPVAGLHSGFMALEHAGATLAYASACDAAFLDVAHVRFMLQRLAAAPGAAVAAPAESEDISGGGRPGRVHPLAAAFRVAPAARAAAELIALGERRAQALVRNLPAVLVPLRELPNGSVLSPCNTREEWALATRLIASRGTGSE